MSSESYPAIKTADTVKLPTVAVIIPCHNHADYVQDAIRSVASQDYPAKVILVVDDGSTDGSADKVKELLTETFSTKVGITSGVVDGGVLLHLIRNDKAKGPSAARNQGIQLIQQQVHLFGMLDADDTYMPNKLSKSIFTLMQDPVRIGLVYSDLLIQNQKTGNIIYEAREPYNRFRLEQECIISNCPIISKLALEHVGVYDEEMRTCEDWDLWLRITERFVAIHVPEALSTYRVTGHNATDTVSKDVWERNWQRVREKMFQRGQRI